MIAFFRSLLHCTKGTPVIETAIVAPVLGIMMMGTFEMGMIVQKQQELQSASTEAESIILAAAAGAGVTSTKLKELLSTSTGLPQANIDLVAKKRCGNAADMVDPAAACPSGQQAYQFIVATFRSSYAPIWKQFGLGSTLNYTVTRTVQVA